MVKKVLRMEGSYDELLAGHAKALEKMDEERRQLFLSLGITEAEFIEAMKDKSRFPPEVWQALQKYRKALEHLIDSQIKPEAKTPSPSKAEPLQVKGHWIFVR